MYHRDGGWSRRILFHLGCTHASPSQPGGEVIDDRQEQDFQQAQQDGLDFLEEGHMEEIDYGGLG